MATFYSLVSLEEAKEYLSHPVLGSRLREITQCLLDYPEDSDPYHFMGSYIDAVKLKSSMTLFDAVSPGDIFAKVLDRYYGSSRCSKTLKFLGGDN